MFFTYFLYSEAFQKIYVGQTSDLTRRLETHNSLENTGWTRKFQPWNIIYFEEFSSRKEALKREKELKSAKGRKFLWEKIKSINE